MSSKVIAQHSIDPTVAASVSNKVMLAASGGTIFFGLTANEVAALGGLCVAVLGLLVNIYFRYKTYKLLKDDKAKEKEL